MKLLIVDDQASVHQYLLKAIDFPALGYDEVLHAENGVEALERVRACAPEVMLLDIQMPGMDGIALLERIASERIARPETIVLTAYDEFQYAKRCIDFGVRRYVLKPIDPREMTDLLREMRQTVDTKQMDAYRWRFPLICARLDDGMDAVAPPEAGDSAFGYCVVCLRAGDAEQPAVSRLDAVSRCARGGMIFLLVSVSTQRAWEACVEALTDGLAARELPAGVSRFRSAPRDSMLDAVREARACLLGSFYENKVRCHCPPPSRQPFPNDLRAIRDCFLRVDSVRLADMAENAFLHFARADVSREDVLAACRELLRSLSVELCGESAPELGAWPGLEGAYHADQLRDQLIDELLALRGRADPTAMHTDTQIIERIHAYVDSHYGEDLSLSAVASKFYISRYQISRLFKQCFGVNYQDYVLSVRMKIAEELLTHTDMRLYEISEAVGFSEPSYFSTVFKKANDLSPRAYRLMKKGAL